MKVQILASAMNQNLNELVESMNISSDAIIINQCDKDAYEELVVDGKLVRFYSMNERGVGRSRNRAIERADRDICLFSDEDIEYVDGYEELIAEEFEKNKDADMLLFNIDVEESRRTYFNTEKKRVHWYNCGRYGAVSFAIRREKLLEAGVKFSLRFGGGATYSNGEDSLFLMELIRKGYRVYTSPVLIGKEKPGDSSWFAGYNRKFFYDRGVLYAVLYKTYALPCVLRFLITHKKTMCTENSIFKAFVWMCQGLIEGYRLPDE